MNINIIPYLKYTEFEDIYKPNHFHTGHDFFIFPKNYSFYDSTKKNIRNFYHKILIQMKYLLYQQILIEQKFLQWLIYKEYIIITQQII